MQQFEGILEIRFSDRTDLTASVYRFGPELSLCWTSSGDVTCEHQVRPRNQENVGGWVREVSDLFSKQVPNLRLHARKMTESDVSRFPLHLQLR